MEKSKKKYVLALSFCTAFDSLYSKKGQRREFL